MSEQFEQPIEATRRIGSSKGNELAEVWMMVDGLEELKDLQAADRQVDTNCDWCGDPSGSGYFVAVSDERYAVCAICWGRSPDYIAFRREGMKHSGAYRKLTGDLPIND